MEKRILTIFIDTSFIIALINERDQYHRQALDLADCYMDQPIVITDAVLLEIANSLARKYKNEAIQVINLHSINILLRQGLRYFRDSHKCDRHLCSADFGKIL